MTSSRTFLDFFEPNEDLFALHREIVYLVRVELIPKNIEVKPDSIAIVGWEEGGAGQIHAWMKSRGTHHVSCFVNVAQEPPDVDAEVENARRSTRLFAYPTRESFKGLPLITTTEWTKALLSLGIARVLITTNDKVRRHQQIREARGAGLTLVSAVHPSAVILDDAVLHDNVIIHAGALIGYKVELHDGVIVNTRSQLDHHTVVKECATIDPGVVTAGNITICRYAHIHSGAILVRKAVIGEAAIVGAGAVVIQDVPRNVTVAGVPAKVLRRHPRSLAHHPPQ